ncbi:acyl-CoA dehydrogenase family protein [Kordia sp.]|uniref:acyl-CoA dehydrogenase family protein n=1 Tax=Kordia sp. TaxID=1965332 RepID=UPI0025C666AD|nr:acyl-CoA dehydrogenase family protein [Kordia sp.]MCH2193241.1 acyl-CoA dehydrogenase family protein [Kordia sp.]
MTTDYYNIAFQYTEEQKLIQESTREWVNRYVTPQIQKCFQKSKPIPNIVDELSRIGAFGLIIPEKYGGMGADYVSYGLMMQELERGDTSVRVMSSIQTSLVMYAIMTFGSEEQKEKYLPKLATGEYLGAFGLTEPNFGSNTAGMHCHFREVDDKIILNGSKMWIGNSTACDIAIVSAKDEKSNVRGIIVETDKISNFNSSLIEDKWSFRASKTGELIFSESEISKSQILPKNNSISDAYECLNIGRYAVAWGSIGIAIDCYETALLYSQQRIQFGNPIASKQLIQKKLAEMITEITKAQLLCYQLGTLMDNNKVNYQQISMAKRSNVEMAQFVAKEARQILGGMGITNDYPIMRHLMNLETLITYQGTHEMHLLITGRDITGINAI